MEVHEADRNGHFDEVGRVTGSIHSVQMQFNLICSQALRPVVT